MLCGRFRSSDLFSFDPTRCAYSGYDRPRCGNDKRGGRVEVCDDVFTFRFVEVFGAAEYLLAGLFDFDEQHVSPSDHVAHDARGSDALLRIVGVERELRVALADVEDRHRIERQIDGAVFDHVEKPSNGIENRKHSG